MTLPSGELWSQVLKTLKATMTRATFETWLQKTTARLEDGRLIVLTPSSFGQDWLDARFEYARTSPESYNHDQFDQGYWTRGQVIGAFIGTDGRDYFARVTARISPDLMLGVDFDYAIIGSTTQNFSGPKEKRFGGSIDVSYRFWDRYSIFAQYQISDVKNRNFRADDDGIDQLVRVQLTRSFR